MSRSKFVVVLAVLFGVVLAEGVVAFGAGFSDDTDDDDLMELYVRHMDETMRGARAAAEADQSANYEEDSRPRRSRRSVLESDSYRAGDPVRQSLEDHSAHRHQHQHQHLRKGRKQANRLNRPSWSPVYPGSSDVWKLKDYLQKEDDLQELRAKRSGEGQEEIAVDPSRSSLPSAEEYLKRVSRKKSVSSGKKKSPSKGAKSRRVKRASPYPLGGGLFSRLERLDDDGDVLLEWDPDAKENVTFRLTAKTRGYVGLGFNDKGRVEGADVLLGWVDDRTGMPVLIDSHGLENSNEILETDESQDVHLLHGTQNDTHTILTFTRSWQACDPQDRSLTGDTVRVLWTLHSNDPEMSVAQFHSDRRGGRALRLRAPAPHQPPNLADSEMFKWDVKLNQFSVSNSSDTVYWCKLFKAPKLHGKHHMIGYTPIIDPANEAIVHHVILYECGSSQPILDKQTKLAGAHCYSPSMPREWDSCLQPVLAWARGSRGEWLPEHVGLPIATEGQDGPSYYMLEVHYNNRLGREVVDSSGVRLHLSPKVRRMEAGILVAGIAISPLHMIPPQQREYATAGYCTPQCTNKMFGQEGINVVSVVLHSHLAGKRLSLKHIRQGKELPPIVQDNQFDFDYQQPHTLAREVKILPGDELVAECVYDTRARNKPTFGGYAADQEMCLAFVVHYPRTPLAACYSMTPVREFFNALNVQSFKEVSIEKVEKLFLTTTTETVTLPVSPNHHSPIYPDVDSSEDGDLDIIKQAKSASISKGDYIDYDDIFAMLVIEKPDEFRDHTLSDHISALAWNDTALSKSIERSLYHGKHVTFCRTREDIMPRAAVIQMFPNYTILPVSNETRCEAFGLIHGSSKANVNYSLLPSLLVLPWLLALSSSLLAYE